MQAKEGWAAAQGDNVVVVLSTELTSELIREGKARDFVRLVQDIRKEIELEYVDRIELGVVTDSGDLRSAIEENEAYIRGETLADSIVFDTLRDSKSFDRQIGDEPFTIYLRVCEVASTTT